MRVAICLIVLAAAGLTSAQLVIDTELEEALKQSEKFTDMWGHEVLWSDPEDGWDDEKKRSLLGLHIQNEMQPPLIPAFTELGFFKTEIPADLYQFILEQRRPFDLTTEKCPDSAHMNCERLVEGEGGKVAKEKKDNVAIMGVTDIKLFRNTINAVMQPILEEWCGVELEPTEIYGIRRYREGSWLQLHVDRMNTHIVSAILQIDQDVDEEWPLMLVDLKGQSRSIALKPGEMLLYESGKVLHGRQRPLKGVYYDNLFVHFKPKKVWYDSEFNMMDMPPFTISKKDLL